MTNIQVKRTVVASFNDRQRAENAIREVRRQGFGPEDIGFVAGRHDPSASDLDAGAEARLCVGLAGFAIPGMGAIVALAETGVTKQDAKIYSDDIERGDVLVIVRTDSDERANQARDILDRNNAVDVQPGHNPGAEPLSADEVRRELQYHGPAGVAGADTREADQALEGKTHWPHSEAHDQAASLQDSRRARIYPA